MTREKAVQATRIGAIAAAVTIPIGLATTDVALTSASWLTLGAILSLAATEASVTRGTLLLGIYALRLGVPFLLAAIFLTRSMVLMNRIKPYMGVIEKFMGGLLIVVGFMLVTGLFSEFSFWLLETFPALATLG